MNFVKYNANPKNKKTGDCVIRAICTALDKPWEVVYREMFELALETGYAVSTKHNYQLYLERQGYEMCKMPRRADRTRYTVEQFVDAFGKTKTNYILNLANHVTCIKEFSLYDIWNCKNKSVGNYWEIKKKGK